MVGLWHAGRVGHCPSRGSLGRRRAGIATGGSTAVLVHLRGAALLGQRLDLRVGGRIEWLPAPPESMTFCRLATLIAPVGDLLAHRLAAAERGTRWHVLP